MSDPFADPDLVACAQIVERGDPDRFAAAMAAPVAARARLFPLYAFNVEVARAPWVTEESMIAEMRLQWWRDALDEIAGAGAVRRHEVTTPLGALLSPAEARRLDQAVAARRWDIYRDPFEDAAHFQRYIDATSGHLMVTAVELLGDGREEPVRDLAFAAGLAAFLRAIPELEARGRVPLLDGTRDGVRRLAQQGLDRLARFRPDAVARAAWPALIPAFTARPILTACLRDPGAVADGRLALGGLRRSWRLMRATRGVF